ncbi:MAG: hypothetical protein K6347_08065 [Campylobacterales bacterium]
MTSLAPNEGFWIRATAPTTVTLRDTRTITEVLTQTLGRTVSSSELAMLQTPISTLIGIPLYNISFKSITGLHTVGALKFDGNTTYGGTALSPDNISAIGLSTIGSYLPYTPGYLPVRINEANPTILPSQTILELASVTDLTNQSRPLASFIIGESPEGNITFGAGDKLYLINVIDTQSGIKTEVPFLNESAAQCVATHLRSLTNFKDAGAENITTIDAEKPAWLAYRIEAGKTYKLSWQDSKDNNGTVQSGDIMVSVWNGNKTANLIGSTSIDLSNPYLLRNMDSGHLTPRYFRTNYDGLVQVEIQANTPGTFALKVEEVNATTGLPIPPSTGQSMAGLYASSSSLSLQWGQSAVIYISNLDESGQRKPFSILDYNSSLISVNSNGSDHIYVYSNAWATGATSITISGNGNTLTIPVSVTMPESNITLSSIPTTLNIGQELTLPYTLGNPSDWVTSIITSNPSIVDANLTNNSIKVHGNNVGEANITITTAYGASASFKINVVSPIAASEISFPGFMSQMYVGSTQTLYPVFSGGGSMITDVNTSDASIVTASINSTTGVLEIYARAPGTATVEVRGDNGSFAHLVVTVTSENHYTTWNSQNAILASAPTMDPIILAGKQFLLDSASTITFDSGGIAYLPAPLNTYIDRLTITGGYLTANLVYPDGLDWRYKILDTNTTTGAYVMALAANDNNVTAYVNASTGPGTLFGLIDTAQYSAS